MRQSAFRFRHAAAGSLRVVLFSAGCVVLCAAQPAVAGLKQEEAATVTFTPPFDASAPADLRPETTIALGTPSRPAAVSPGTMPAALPSPVQPDTVIDAVTVGLPVWPWSTPVETHLDDPKQGYNIWTYGLALLLIVGGLLLGRRRTEEAAKPEKPRLGLGARQPGAAD